MLCGACYLIFGYYNNVYGFFPYPYNGFMVWFIGIILVVNIFFYLMIRGTTIKMRENSEKTSILRRYIIRMTEKSPYIEEIPFRMELIRKSFHFSGLLLLIAFFGIVVIPPVAQIINDAVIVFINNPEVSPSYFFLWGDIADYPYASGDPQAVIDLTMFGIMGSLVFAINSDIIRVVKGPEYSLFNFLTKSMLRKKELNAAGPQVYIITGFIFSYMLFMAGCIHILAYFAGILISCLSDAAAAIFGRKYGKHKVKLRNNQVKSVEGFIAGSVIAYFIGLIFLGPIYAIFGAIIFFLTDYLPVFTADNILNPIVIPIGFQLMILLLGLPVGWF
jgi:dolichol kinase